MCQCVNKVTLIGFLGDAPELKFSQQGKPVCTFSLAVNERWKDADGAPRERVEWFQDRLLRPPGRGMRRIPEYRQAYLLGRPVADPEVGRPWRRKAHSNRSRGQPDADSGSSAPKREQCEGGGIIEACGARR